MRSVAEAIKRRHAGAVEVRLARRRETPDGLRRLVLAGNHVTAVDDDVSADDLVHYTISPDYCLPDKTVGSVGTRHRYAEKKLYVNTQQFLTFYQHASAISATVMPIISVSVRLVAWQRALILYRRRRFINHLLTYLLTYSGRTLVFDRRTFAVLRSTYS